MRVVDLLRVDRLIVVDIDVAPVPRPIVVMVNVDHGASPGGDRDLLVGIILIGGRRAAGVRSGGRELVIEWAAARVVRGSIHLDRIPLDFIRLEDIRNKARPGATLGMLPLDHILIHDRGPAVAPASGRLIFRIVARERRDDSLVNRAAARAVGRQRHARRIPLINGGIVLVRAARGDGIDGVPSSHRGSSTRLVIDHQRAAAPLRDVHALDIHVLRRGVIDRCRGIPAKYPNLASTGVVHLAEEFDVSSAYLEFIDFESVFDRIEEDREPRIPVRGVLEIDSPRAAAPRKRRRFTQRRAVDVQRVGIPAALDDAIDVEVLRFDMNAVAKDIVGGRRGKEGLVGLLKEAVIQLSQVDAGGVRRREIFGRLGDSETDEPIAICADRRRNLDRDSRENRHRGVDNRGVPEGSAQHNIVKRIHESLLVLIARPCCIVDGGLGGRRDPTPEIARERVARGWVLEPRDQSIEVAQRSDREENARGIAHRRGKGRRCRICCHHTRGRGGARAVGSRRGWPEQAGRLATHGEG